jgi:hypothetical protein
MEIVDISRIKKMQEISKIFRSGDWKPNKFRLWTEGVYKESRGKEKSITVQELKPWHCLWQSNDNGDDV